MNNKERRKYPRVPVFTPISYICEDAEGNSLHQNMGVARNVSQTGIQIEPIQMIKSKYILVMFVDLKKKQIETRGEVVYCKNNELGKYITGIKLQGSEKDIIKFVGEIVRFYHYQKDTPRAIISPTIPN